MQWFVARRAFLVGSILLAGLIPGCGSGGPKLDPSTQATISGKVLINGEPAPVNSSVYFSCKETGTTAAGKIDALGNFSATAPDPKQGISKGRYYVMVRPPEPASIAPSADDPRYREQMMNASKIQKSSTEPSVIPKHFLLIDTTKLVLEVKPGPNTFDIDLAKIK